MLSPYLTWVLIFLVTPSIILWLFFWKHLYKYLSVFVAVIVCSIIGGLSWDIYAVKTDIWSWPGSCCSMRRLLLGIPSEEIIWAIAAAFYVCTITIIARDIVVTHKKLKKRAP